MLSRVRPLSTLPLALGLSGCAQTVLLADPDPADTADTADTAAVDTPCAAPETVPLTVTFPPRAPGCPWGEGDNGAASEGLLTARAEEVVPLALDGAARICGVTLDFRDPDAAPVLAYDDAFLLTFGDVVLAASHAPMVEELAADGMLRLYEWAPLFGFPVDLEDADAWCLGGDEGLATCAVPPPGEPGSLTLEFDAAVAAEVGERAYAAGRFEVGFVTFGDNDVATDCSHGGFAFTVAVAYDPT